MEYAIIIILAVLLAVSVALNSKTVMHRSEKVPYRLYLMKIDEHGNIEIKRAAKPDMWDWKFK